MEHPRTTAARDHDDSALIDSMEPGPSHGGASGGTMARDIGAQDEIAHVAEPNAATRVRKGNAIEHAQERRPDRPRAPDNE